MEWAAVPLYEIVEWVGALNELAKRDKKQAK